MTPRSSQPRPLHKWPAPSANSPSESGFLLRHGARRLSPEPTPEPAEDSPGKPDFLAPKEAEPGKSSPASDGSRRLHWEEEHALQNWKPLDIPPGVGGLVSEWRSAPLRFVSSCDAGHEVAWLRDRESRWAPLRLAQIGAIALRASLSEAKRELGPPWARVERVVALAADRFEWDQVEEWSAHLLAHGFRLLIVPSDAPAQEAGLSQTVAARARTLEEALRMEREAMRAEPDSSEPIILGGPLGARRGDFEPLRPAIALCRLGPLLPPRITPEWQPDAPEVSDEEDEQASIPRAVWRALSELRPGQRTPVWICDEAACPVSCWFVRLHAASGSGDSPLPGVARVEVRRELWESQAYGSELADGVSRLLLDAQEPESARLRPLVRASQHLRAMLTPSAALEARFGQACGL